MKHSVKIILFFVLSAVFLAGVGQLVFAYVMSSGDYQIQSDDALTPTGGIGTSANYIFSDTMGQVSSGISDSSLYKIKAGFQHMQDVSLSVSSPGDTTLTPNIPGISGGTANADTHWTVQTDGSAGFDMKLNASTIPAMKLPPDGTYYFDDYPTTPTYNWDIGLNAAKLGFTVVPATANDIVLALADNDSICGAGSNVGNCWSGFNGTTPIPIIHRTIRTDVTGENELVAFQAQSNKFLKSGSYSASITVTVSSN